MDKNGSSSLSIGQQIRNVGRFTQIVNILARHGFWSALEISGIRSWLTPEQAKAAEGLSTSESNVPVHQVFNEESGPRRLREALEELGPAFVKLGQLLASREDLLPESYLRDLRRLHHSVTALPFSQIQKVLQDELGEGLKDFQEISETPLAAGSIGQVHRAVLKSGQNVVLKVQRPNIAEQIHTDLGLMELLSTLVEKYLPQSRALRPSVIVREFMRAIESELDFVREAGSTLKLMENFSEVDTIELPEVFMQYTTPRVLTMTYMDGYALTEKEALSDANLDPKVLVENGLNMFLKMVFVDGMYHGDLHAGNILALPNNRIGLLDCGLTIRLSRSIRENFAGLLVALVEEDYETLVSYFVELADPEQYFDLTAFEDAVANELSPYLGMHIKKIRVGKLLWRLAKISAEHGAPVPRPLILIFRTLATFEGLASSLAPDFDVLRTCEEFSSEIAASYYSKEYIERQGLSMLRDLANLAKHAPRQIRGLLKQLAQGDLEVNIASKDLLSVASSLDRLVSRIAVSVILASLIIGSSILVLARVGQEFYHMSAFGVAGFAIAGILSLYVVWSIIRGGGRF